MGVKVWVQHLFKKHIFKTLVGILYRPADLLISTTERINLIFSLSAGERKNES